MESLKHTLDVLHCDERDITPSQKVCNWMSIFSFHEGKILDKLPQLKINTFASLNTESFHTQTQKHMEAWPRSSGRSRRAEVVAEESLPTRLCPECQWWVEGRRKTSGWRRLDTTGQSWPNLRTHSRTDTRRWALQTSVRGEDMRRWNQKRWQDRKTRKQFREIHFYMSTDWNQRFFSDLNMSYVYFNVCLYTNTVRWAYTSVFKAAYSIFVEEIKNHVGQSGVAPVSVDQQELLEISETWESKVARHHRLQKNSRGNHHLVSSTLYVPSPAHTHTPHTLVLCSY